MKKKEGFISTSLIYSFFLVFMMLLTGIILTYARNRVLTNSIKQDIIATIEAHLQE